MKRIAADQRHLKVRGGKQASRLTAAHKSQEDINMKKTTAILVAGIMVLAMTGCGAKEAAPAADASALDTAAQTAAEESTEAQAADNSTDDAFADTLAALGDTSGTAEDASTGEDASAEEGSADTRQAASGDSSAALPAYEYPGPEAFYYDVYQYLVKELGQNFEAADVSIPNVIEIALDETNKDDIIMYGDFWLFNYKLDGDTLVAQSGGDFPGVLHIKQTDSGFEVTRFDVVEDGSNSVPSAKKLFGDHYDEFSKLMADDEKKEANRRQIIANYAAANNLNITKVQDYGWDPVDLPEENIDSFYSQLN